MLDTDILKMSYREMNSTEKNCVGNVIQLNNLACNKDALAVFKIVVSLWGQIKMHELFGISKCCTLRISASAIDARTYL